jgi:hypothetical protein
MKIESIIFEKTQRRLKKNVYAESCSYYEPIKYEFLVCFGHRKKPVRQY